jgi:CMP-N,N'-diacetyllegionaminic acid synthase
MHILGLIPARAGSRGVPRKNLRLLAGKPLLAYTIEAAAQSCIERLLVSTEAPEIAAVAQRYGAEVPFLRPAALAASSGVTSMQIVQHALDYLYTTEDYQPDVVVYLQPTSPLRTAAHIDSGIRLLCESDADSVVSVRQVESEHPYFMMRLEQEHWLREYIEMDHKPLSRQDAPPLYLLNGALYISRWAYLARASETAPLFSRRCKGLLMDPLSSVDINTPLDFLLAETILRHYPPVNGPALVQVATEGTGHGL